MDLFFLSISGPVAFACFLCGAIVGVLITTVYYLSPGVLATKEQSETKTEQQ